MALKYFKRYHTKEDRAEITYDEALDTLLTTYWYNDMTRDLLSIPNNIWCRFSTVYVEDPKGDGDIEVLMPGLHTMLPMDVEYDEKGNRV